MLTDPKARKTLSEISSRENSYSLNIAPGTNLKLLCTSCAQKLVGSILTITENLVLIEDDLFTIGDNACIMQVVAKAPVSKLQMDTYVKILTRRLYR